MTNIQHEMSISDHETASKLPRTADKPTIFPSPDLFSSFVRSVDAPKKLDDWIYSDRPQLSIHTVSFDDATILTITWPHTLADVMGIAIFLNAWTALLRGDPSAVPKLQDFRSNPLTLLGQRTLPVKYMHFGDVLGPKDRLCFAGLYILDRLRYRREERRTICLPASCLQNLRRAALDELSTPMFLEGKSIPFVSEGDVLLAWWVRTLYGALGLRPNKTIMVCNVLNLRTSLHETFMSVGSVYMGNALCMSPTFLKGRQILDEPLGQTALRIRRSLSKQRTTEQVEAMAALQLQAIERTGYPALVGDPQMLILPCSNWHKARLFDMDFSAAVCPDSSKPNAQRSLNVGKPSYVNGIHYSPLSLRNVLSVIGKDAAGNLWLTGVLRTGAWTQIQEQLDVLSMGRPGF
jgi:hypothetical protein